MVYRKHLPNGLPKASTQRPYGAEFGAALWSVIGIGLCSGQGASRAACLFRFCHFTFRTSLLVSQSNWLHFSEVGTLFPSRFLPLGLLRRYFNEATGDSHVITAITAFTVRWFVGSLAWFHWFYLLGSQVSSKLALFPTAGFSSAGFTAEVLARPVGRGFTRFVSFLYSFCLLAATPCMGRSKRGSVVIYHSMLSHSPHPLFPTRGYSLLYFSITLYHSSPSYQTTGRVWGTRALPPSQLLGASRTGEFKSAPP